MGIMLKALVSIAAIASLASSVVLPANTKQLARRDACSSGLFANVLVIGASSGGDDFCESRIESSGEVIAGLEVWSDQNGIRGILITYSGGQAIMHGSQTGDTNKAITLAPGERVLAAALWGDGQGRKLGHIYLKTDKQEFDVGMGKPNNGYQINVGGGLLVGVTGATADYIARLAFLFLSPKVVSVSVSDMKIDSDPTGTSDNLEPSYLIRSTMGNPSGSNGSVSFTVTGSEKVTQSTTWEQSSTATFGGSISIEISGEIAGIGTKATTGFEWSFSDTSSQSTQISDEITLTQTAGPIVIAPGHGKACQIFAQKGNGNFAYTSTVTLNLDNGQSIQYQENGNLVSVQYSQVQASCDDANDPKDWSSTTNNPPAGVQIVGKGLVRRRPLPPLPIL
ncbi:MAG: hypothetical protein LQ352_007652 [Teloschistes flavicans]|nr:MAG: hypothetical protein LQ352_007652 [Teloschistes flavicans]